MGNIKKRAKSVSDNLFFHCFPIHLKPADGAIGSHLTAVQDAYKDFKRLAEKLALRTHV
jgi:hypothetical protein